MDRTARRRVGLQPQGRESKAGHTHKSTMKVAPVLLRRHESPVEAHWWDGGLSRIEDVLTAIETSYVALPAAPE